MKPFVFLTLSALNILVVGKSAAMYQSLEQEPKEEVVIFEELDPAMQVFYNDDLRFPLISAKRPLPRSEKIHENCLTNNIFHEARGEDTVGQAGVASVTINRVLDSRWPDNVCGVVYQHKQFSWTLSDVRINFKNSKQHTAYEKAREIAAMALGGELEDETGGSTHYYAQKEFGASGPWWAPEYERVAIFGGHTFLK